jgi:glycosyltransferase involved in cell wall biosynthesis
MSTEAQREKHVLHVSAWREDLGGIQSLLTRHRELDPTLGLRPAFVSVFDPVNTWPGEARSLAADGRTRIGALKSSFRMACAGLDCGTAIYHDGWGMEWFAPLDGASRRILYLHTERPHLESLLKRLAPLADAVVGVSGSLLAALRRASPDFPEERLFLLPLPVTRPSRPIVKAGSKPEGKVLRLGYAGRVERGHKRLDRLPLLLAELDALGLSWSFEVLGEGAYLGELRKSCASDPRVTFRGRLSGEDYWRALSAWDALVFLSDYEGTSLAALEAMSLGIPVVYPEFSPAARELLGPCSGGGLYPVGDMKCAALRLKALSTLNEKERAEIGAQLMRLAEPHTGEAYAKAYSHALEQAIERPARACASAAIRWPDWLPLGVYTRLFPRRF